MLSRCRCISLPPAVSTWDANQQWVVIPFLAERNGASHLYITKVKKNYDGR